VHMTTPFPVEEGIQVTAFLRLAEESSQYNCTSPLIACTRPRLTVTQVNWNGGAASITTSPG